MGENALFDGRTDATRLPARLALHGALLFLLGLLTGVVSPALANPRMGLATHQVGVVGGTFLIALGAAWPLVRLTTRWAVVSCRLVIYGNYGNWLFAFLAAAFGTRVFSPVTGTRQGGPAWQEAAVGTGFVAVGVALVVGTALVAWGIGRAGTNGLRPVE